LSAVRDWLFSTFAATLYIERPFLHPQPEDAPYFMEKWIGFIWLWVSHNNGFFWKRQ
jgi:hypothetical protein